MELTLDALIDPAKGDNPSDAIATLFADAQASRDTVESLRTEAISRFTELRGKDSVSSDDMATLQVLAEVADAAAGELGRIEEAEAEMQSQLDALDARMNPDGGTGEVDDDTPDGEEAVDADAEVVTPEPAAAAVAPVPPPDDEDKPKAPAPVAASQRRHVVLSQLQKQAPQPKPQAEATISMTAAADVRGFDAGQNLPDLAALARAAKAKFKAMPRNGTAAAGTLIKAGVAQITPVYPDDLVVHDDFSDVKAIERAVDVQGRTGKALVAAGGWCAPSEILWQLAPGLESANSGLIDLPGVQVARGGIRTPQTPDYSDVLGGNVGLVQTETQASSVDPEDYTKDVYRIPCLAWDETRADVIYTIIEAGILQADAFPENDRRHVELALALHAHKINASSIARMVAKSTTVNFSALGPGVTNSLLNSIGLLVKHVHYKYRAQPNLMVEVVLPEYVKELVRADYSLRSGIPLELVTDGKIDSWFGERKGRVQWVYDWQDAATGATGNNAFGGAAPIVQYPTAVEALVYPAGTFVRGRGDVVNLDGVYDSTNVKVNDYLRLMVEEKLLVHQQAYVSYKATIPTLVNGTTSAPLKLDGNGKIAA